MASCGYKRRDVSGENHLTRLCVTVCVVNIW